MSHLVEVIAQCACDQETCLTYKDKGSASGVMHLKTAEYSLILKMQACFSCTELAGDHARCWIYAVQHKHMSDLLHSL